MDPKQDPSRHCQKPNEWPEAVRTAWRDANTKGDVLTEGGRSAHWSPKTRVTVEKSYGRWLTWLKANGLLQPMHDVADHVTREVVARYIVDLTVINAPFTVRSRILNLYFALSAMAPDMDWGWLCAVARRLRKMATPVREKRPRLVGSDVLFAFGLELMQEAERAGEGTPLFRAKRYRDGLIIAFLAVVPLRRANLASMEIGTHFLEHPDGYWVHFDGEETKTGVEIDRPAPQALRVFFDRYLAEYRPFLVRCSERRSRKSAIRKADALWISAYGTPMSEGAIYGRITLLTKAKFGRALTPHLFRDCAATTIATVAPELVAATKDVLNHSNGQTAERHYNHARSLQASRTYQAHVANLQRTL